MNISVGFKTWVPALVACVFLASANSAWAQTSKEDLAAQAHIQGVIDRMKAAVQAGEAAGEACNTYAFATAQKSYDAALADLKIWAASSHSYTAPSFPIYPEEACSMKAWQDSHPNGPAWQAYPGANPGFPKDTGGAGFGQAHHLTTNCPTCRPDADTVNTRIDTYNGLVAGNASVSAIKAAQSAMNAAAQKLNACEKTCTAAANQGSGTSTVKSSGAGLVGSGGTGTTGTTGSGFSSGTGGGQPTLKTPSPTPAPTPKSTPVIEGPAKPSPTPLKSALVAPNPTTPVSTPVSAGSPTGLAPKSVTLPTTPVVKAPLVLQPPAKTNTTTTPTSCPAGQKLVTIAGKTTCSGAAALVVGH